MFLVAVSLGLLGSVLHPAAVRAAPVSSTACDAFPADNAWHRKGGGLPEHPRSADWKRTSHARRTLLHPDFGPPSYGIPFDVVGAAHRDVSIDFRCASESDPRWGPGSDPVAGSTSHRSGPALAWSCGRSRPTV